jgi:hypothetical protein
MYSRSFCTSEAVCEYWLDNSLINEDWMKGTQENREITITPEPKDGKSMYIKGSAVSSEGVHFHCERSREIQSRGSHTRHQRQMWRESFAPLTLCPNIVDIPIMLSAGLVAWPLLWSDPRFRHNEWQGTRNFLLQHNLHSRANRLSGQHLDGRSLNLVRLSSSTEHNLRVEDPEG